MTAAHGGRRAGAGRKARLNKYVGPVIAAERQIVDKLPQLVEAHLKLALGQIMVQEVDVKGDTDIYALAPSERSLEYLLNRIMGKPTERIEIDDPDGPSVTVQLELTEEVRARVRAALIAPPVAVAPTP